MRSLSETVPFPSARFLGPLLFSQGERWPVGRCSRPRWRNSPRRRRFSFPSLLRAGEDVWKRTFGCHIIIGMEKGKTDKLVSALVEKSKESAYLAVEIMNKPTIHYRTEGFCFFICNAWELLLKAFLIRERGGGQHRASVKGRCPENQGPIPVHRRRLHLNRQRCQVEPCPHCENEEQGDPPRRFFR